MATKKEMVDKALSHVKNFESIKGLVTIVELKDGKTVVNQRAMYR